MQCCQLCSVDDAGAVPVGGSVGESDVGLAALPIRVLLIPTRACSRAVSVAVVVFFVEVAGVAWKTAFFAPGAPASAAVVASFGSGVAVDVVVAAAVVPLGSGVDFAAVVEPAAFVAASFVLNPMRSVKKMKSIVISFELS